MRAEHCDSEGTVSISRTGCPSFPNILHCQGHKQDPLEASSPPASYHCAASPSSSQETALRCCGAWFLHEAPPPSRGYSEDSWVHPNGQDRCEGNSSHLTQGQVLDTRYQTRKLHQSKSLRTFCMRKIFYENANERILCF